MTAPESARWSRRTQRGIGIRRRRRERLRPRRRPRSLLLRPHQEGDVPGVDRLAGGEGARRAAPQLGQQRPQLADDELLRDLLVVDAEHRQQVLLVAEVAERAVTQIVQEARQAQRLFDQRQGRRLRLDLDQGGVHLPRQLTGEVHGAQAVGEAAVLGGGEHPPRALQLVDALEALHPRVVDDVRLGDLPRTGQRDAQVAVQGVGDEVDVVVGELHAPHPIARVRTATRTAAAARRRRRGRAPRGGERRWYIRLGTDTQKPWVLVPTMRLW